MDKRNYSLSRIKMGNELVYFEYDKIDGYKVMPKAKKKDSIEVNKIIFVNNSLTLKFTFILIKLLFFQALIFNLFT